MNQAVPVRVTGDIQWGVNLVVDGSCSCREEASCHSATTTKDNNYLVWLINNKGIVKYFGEPADVDLSKTATVTVGLGRLADFVPFDADSGERLPVTDGAFQVSVPPGDVRFVRIGLQKGE